MLTDIEEAFKGLVNCLQSLRMYGPDHPMFVKTLDAAHNAFETVFALRQEMVIGIIGEELAFEKEILFDLGKFLRPTVLYLKERNIQRLAFLRGLTKDELRVFVEFIAKPKEDFKVDSQQALEFAGVSHINIGKLKVHQGINKINFSLAQDTLYDSSAQKIKGILSGVLNAEKIDHLALKFSLNNLMESLGSQRQELLKLATLKNYNAETYVHLLNVSILAMYFSSHLGFDKNDVLNIGVAAMFHDIGKLFISRKVLNKASQLSAQEVGNIQSHTILGAQIMLSYVDTLGILPVVVSFEHHLKYDGSGYPRLPLLRKQHIASSIVAICDVYDALLQRRGYKQDYAPDVVYNIMNKDKGSSFSPELLDKFFRFMGFWPIGSVVALNDESVALVVEENQEDIYRPKVKVVWPEDKKRLVDLLQDTGLSVQRYLNPWKEGKEFLSG
ncbi:MAG: HD domain-containing phosphohydrolase [Candidatus Omnitrophota bacterium]